MTSEFFNKLPKDEQEALKKQVLNTLNKSAFVITEKDIDEWSKHNSEEQNKFNNQNTKKR